MEVGKEARKISFTIIFHAVGFTVARYIVICTFRSFPPFNNSKNLKRIMVRDGMMRGGGVMMRGRGLMIRGRSSMMIKKKIWLVGLVGQRMVVAISNSC